MCSPYVVTVLVSCPQNARVTMKADLIFEEYGKIYYFHLVPKLNYIYLLPNSYVLH